MYHFSRPSLLHCEDTSRFSSLSCWLWMLQQEPVDRTDGKLWPTWRPRSPSCCCDRMRFKTFQNNLSEENGMIFLHFSSLLALELHVKGGFDNGPATKAHIWGPNSNRLVATLAACSKPLRKGCFMLFCRNISIIVQIVWASWTLSTATMFFNWSWKGSFCVTDYILVLFHACCLAAFAFISFRFRSFL